MSASPIGSTASQNILVIGGLLVALGYLFWMCNALAPEVVPGSSNVTISYASLLNYGIATLLLAVGVTALVRSRTFRGASRVGGWLLVAGFLLWAVGAVTGPMPFRLPWWFLHLSPLCIIFGSALFGIGGFTAGLVNRSGVLLVTVGGALGMLLIDGPELLWDITGIDLAPSTVWRVLGYLLLLVFGLGWIILGRSRASAYVRR